MFVKTGSMTSVKYANKLKEKKTGIPGTTRKYLEYIGIRMECHHFGDFKSTSNAKKTKSNKNGCEAFIQLNPFIHGK